MEIISAAHIIFLSRHGGMHDNYFIEPFARNRRTEWILVENVCHRIFMNEIVLCQCRAIVTSTVVVFVASCVDSRKIISLSELLFTDCLYLLPFAVVCVPRNIRHPETHSHRRLHEMLCIPQSVNRLSNTWVRCCRPTVQFARLFAKDAGQTNGPFHSKSEKRK